MILLNATAEDELPQAPGVYGFYLLLCSRQRIGLIGLEPFSLEQLENAKENLSRRLDKIQRIYASKALEGTVKEKGKSAYLSEFYDISLIQRNINNISHAIGGVDVSALPDLVDAIEQLSLMVGPIYCGMTCDQTLEQRYFQHKADFYRKSCSGTFGARFAEYEMLWDDLIFSCVPVAGNRKNIRSIERAMHILLKAPLSTL